MTAERDIAGFALPFAAGILSGALFPFSDISFAGPVSCVVLCAVTAFLLHESFLALSFPLQLFSIGTAAFLCGLLCRMAACCMELSATDSMSFPEEIAKNFCIRLKNTIESIPFEKQESAALIKALITGDRSGLPGNITGAFRESGAAHILALSGMHLGIIYGILVKLLSFLGNNRSAICLRSAVTMLSCGFYTLATGAGESITRAFLFIVLNESARLAYRKPGLRTIMPAALIIQLSTDPSAISSAAFLLSYAAIAGIAYIHPKLKACWRGLPQRKSVLRKIWESASLTISCQLTTGPLAWFMFRSFPLNFLITNLIAIPLTSLIIGLSLCCIILESIGLCPPVLTHVTEKCVSLLTGALEIIAVM